MRALPTGDPAPRSSRRSPGCARIAAAAFAAALALPLPASAAPPVAPLAAEPPASPTGRPRIGLVLSGGGARGLSHIGVIKVLEELRVPVDYVAATSMGSIVGGFYASGMTAAEMEREVRAIDWARMFSDSPPRADLSVRDKDYQALYPLPLEVGFGDGSFKLFKGAISGANLELWLHQKLIATDDLGGFDELAVPFRAVATDMVTGKEVVFDRGPLYHAIRASMSVPGLFAPFESGGRVYGDGGLVNNLPVDVVQKLGADIVIAVNIGTPLMTREQLTSVIGFASQSLNILTEQNVRASLARLKPSDVLISPDLGELTSFDFTRAEKLIALGEASARAAAARLANLALSADAYAAYQASRRRPLDVATLPIDRVRVQGTRFVAPEAVAAVVESDVGGPLELARLEAQIGDLYGWGDFERIEYRIIDERGRRDLVVDVTEKSWGPNFLRFGLQLDSDLQGDAGFNLIVGHKRTWLNRWGAEWINEISLGSRRLAATEFYQPIGVRIGPFVSAYAAAILEPGYVFAGPDRVAEYDVSTLAGGLDAGWALDRWAEVRAGIRYERLSAKPTVALPLFGTLKADDGGFSLRIRYDRLSDPFFPRSGTRIVAEGFQGIPALSDGGSVTRFHAESITAFPIGEKSSLVLGLRAAASDREFAEFAAGFQLGGLFNLSGLRKNQLSGNYLGLARLAYQQHMGALPLLGRAWYVGASAETGNVWRDRGDASASDLVKAGSVYLAADTYLGPFYFAWGRASTGQSSWYLFLGRP
ncbi:MAG: patatin-like phospholipase family protein [Burkholderiales bacterium]